MASKDDPVRARLQRAALELFGEHGYDRITAAEIAARAGVTERTFFRHFPDKREVLFDGEAILGAALTAAIGEVPGEVGALDTVFRVFRSVLPAIENNRPFAKPRHEVISATAAMRERETAKTAALADMLAAALRARGVSELPATLAAQVGMAAFVQATVAWLELPEPGLRHRLDLAERELKALVADSDHA